MAVRTTRTLNPLPFADLEPHRFEDLVRQLAYEFRSWHSLEAIGRSGGDEGMDVRGLEIVPADDEGGDVPDDDEQPKPGPRLRTWIFQCKREKTMGPQSVRDAVAESLPHGTTPPHGFVLASSADLSKKARDAFRAEMVARGVEEFHAWARGELEDMLFQPRNDRLLFAYFGLSLQPRRRSMATKIRSEVALKKLLRGLFEPLDGGPAKHRYLLLRDPNDDGYPQEPDDESAKRHRWLLCEFHSLRHPGHLSVIEGEYYAWVPADQKGWDYLPQHNLVPQTARVHFPRNSFRDPHERHQNLAHAYWEEYVPEAEKAWLKRISLVPLDRIIAVDPIGDGCFPLPQVMVEFGPEVGPFHGDLGGYWLKRIGSSAAGFDLRPTTDNRIAFFPEALPETVFPAPPCFHHDVPRDRWALSESSSAALVQLLNGASEKRKEQAPAQGATAEGPTAEASAFSTWSRSVVLPVFGAVLDLLGKHGFHGRIVVNDPTAGAGLYSGSVELRLRPVTGPTHNPDYRPLAAVRFSWASHRKNVAVEYQPQDHSSSSKDRDLALPLDTLTAEAVEGHVIEMLKRITQKPWW